MVPSKLSVLCITQAEPYAAPFLIDLAYFAHTVSAQCVIACDGREALDRAHTLRWQSSEPPTLITVKSRGYLESVHDLALCGCKGEYVLRMDDDERISDAMKLWLLNRKYEAQPHWKFPRVHFWRDTSTVLLTPHLYPDHQTRLSIKAMAGKRDHIHCGSPYGGGEEAPVQIEHHKFLVKTFEERLRIARTYDTVSPGSGTGGFAVFNLPERAYAGLDVTLGTYGAGDATWSPVTRVEHIA